MKKLTFFALALAMILTNGAQAFSLYSIFDSIKQHPFMTTIFFGTAAFWCYKQIEVKNREMQLRKAAAALPQINIFIPHHLDKSDAGHTEYSQWNQETKADFWKQKPNPAIEFNDNYTLAEAKNTERAFFIKFKEQIDLAKAIQLSLQESNKVQPFKSKITNPHSMEQDS